jgi:hypothetical protein
MQRAHVIARKHQHQLSMFAARQPPVNLTAPHAMATTALLVSLSYHGTPLQVGEGGVEAHQNLPQY